MLRKCVILIILIKLYQTIRADSMEYRIIFPNTKDTSSSESFKENRDNHMSSSNLQQHQNNRNNRENSNNRVNSNREPPRNQNFNEFHGKPTWQTSNRGLDEYNSKESDIQNINTLNGSTRRINDDKNNKRKKQSRLCEQKYMEYMTRIFHDEDTVADGSDSDFNGRTLAEPGEYPHMTAVGFGASNGEVDYKCGGSLISESFVVTAAHCTNLTGQRPTKVRIGDLNLMVEERYLEPQIRNIKRIYKHPDYRSNLYYNDIALLEMDEEVEFTEFVRPIRLWIDDDLPANTIAHAMGYGATAFGKAQTNRLTDLNLTIVLNTDCNSELPELPETPSGILSSQICAKDYLMNRDTCQGDSGGPLQLNLHGRRRRNRKHYHLIGITSYGLFCRSNYPSVYTRISSFLDWIENTVWSSQIQL